MLIPVSQMMGNISDNNRDAFENVIMQLVMRLCELSDIDISQQTADQIGNKLVMQAMGDIADVLMGQQGQIDQMQQAMSGMMPQGPGGPVPPEGAVPGPAPQMPLGANPQAALPPEVVQGPPIEEGMPMPEMAENPMPVAPEETVGGEIPV